MECRKGKVAEEAVEIVEEVDTKESPEEAKVKENPEETEAKENPEETETKEKSEETETKENPEEAATNESPEIEYTPVGINDVVTEEVIKEIFKNYNKSLEVQEFEASIGTAPGDNFSSLMYSVLVTTKNKKTGNISVIPMMFKAIPRNPIRVKMMTESKFFVKEYEMYKKVIPQLATPGLSFKAHPKVFHAFHDGIGDYIAMEDLRPLGFKTENRIKGWDMDHVRMVMKELAKFHAFSFVTYNGDGNLMLEQFPFLDETFWQKPEMVQEMYIQFINNTFKDIVKIVDQEGFAHNRQRVEWLIDDIFQKMHNLTSVSEKYPSVITHGDCWTNNVLFKHNSKGKPTELKFVDFQICKVGSRMLDLSYILYTSVSIPILNTSSMDILRIYYDSFNDYCDELGADMPLRYNGQQLSWKRFQNEWSHYQHYGTTMALFLLPIMTASAGEIDIENIKQSDIDAPDNEPTRFEKVWANEPLREKVVNIVDIIFLCVLIQWN